MHIFAKLRYFKSKNKNNKILVVSNSSKPNHHHNNNNNKIENKDILLKKQKNLIMDCLANSALNFLFFKNKKKFQVAESFVNKFIIVSIHPSKTGVKPILPNNEGMEISNECSCCPLARSGHRIFATDNYIYLIGGFNANFSPKIFNDIWRFNLATERWQEGSMRNGIMPTCLASFSLSQTKSKNETYIFGGTGVPFGVKTSNDIYKVTIEASGSVSFEPQIIESVFDHYPPKIYGHAMTYVTRFNPITSSIDEIIYLVGGTTGHVYNMDVWKLQKKTETKNVWNCFLLTDRIFEAELGRYRLEIIIHKNYLITFGGGSPIFCGEFDNLLCFNLTEERYENLPTKQDPENGYPKCRKCHAIVEFENSVYIIGGCQDVQSDRIVMDDIWRFNLLKFEWSKLDTKLPIPVFFHSAAVTLHGCVYVFGGCTDSASTYRTNHIQKIWLKPPPLNYFALNAILNAAPQLRSVESIKCSANTVESGDIVLTKPNNIVLKLMEHISL